VGRDLAKSKPKKVKIKKSKKPEYSPETAYQDYKALREEGFDRGEAVAKVAQKYGQKYMKVDDDTFRLERKDKPSFQKIVEDTKKVEPRLKEGDETNLASNFVNPFVKQNKPVIEKEVAKFEKKYPKAPKIHVLESHLDLQMQFPHVDFEDLYRNNAFIHPETNEVYLVATATSFQNKALVQQAIFHEIFGHYGVRRALDYTIGLDGKVNKKFSDFMISVFDDKQSDPMMRSIYESYRHERGLPKGLNFKDMTDYNKVYFAEEYVAHVAETNIDKPLIKRIVDWFREILGIDSSVTDDMIRDVIANGRAMVQVGDNMVSRGPLMFQKRVAQGVDQQPVFQKAPPTDSKARS
jgi:hypothetical protein